MDASVTGFIEKLELGEKQEHGGMTVFPLRSALNGAPHYTTLAEALREKMLTISEVSQGGSVPELNVVNGGDKPVLLLDGEEVAGAKQNRVLNTTILIRRQSKTVIPVSCTEQGRWSYRSDVFSDSGVVAPIQMRRRKTMSVSESLHESRSFRSDQGEVWASVQEYTQASGATAPTSAMRDAFESRKGSIEDYQREFPGVENQKGLLVLIDNEVAGLDFVSQPDAYAALHPKLVGSYAMEALTRGKGHAADGADEKAKSFLADALKIEDENRFKSPGHGWDHRFRGRMIVGSALLWHGIVIHMALFHNAGEATERGKMSDFRRRRGFRAF